MVVTVENIDRIRFRSFVNPLYRDTTVSRYLSDKSLKAKGEYRMALWVKAIYHCLVEVLVASTQ